MQTVINVVKVRHSRACDADCKSRRENQQILAAFPAKRVSARAGIASMMA
jgi:hypothetical protein